jgi:hypothetical protein
VKKTNEEYGASELHKPSKDFTQFAQSGGEDKSVDFLTQADEQMLHDWLINDGDTQEGAQEVIECCVKDIQARNFFLSQARAAL